MKAIKTYKDFLTATKEDIDGAKAILQSREMSKKGEMELIKIEGEILEAETKINDLKSKYPIDYAEILRAIDKMELLKRKQKKFDELLTELFPNEK